MSKNGNILLVALLFLGAVLTLIGLANLSSGTGWSHSGRYHFAVFFGFCLLVVVIGSHLTQKPPRFTGAIFALGITFLAGVWWPVIVTLWFVFASILLGYHIQTLLGINSANRQPALLFLTGAGSYGSLVGLLAHFPVNYPSLYGFGLLAPFLINQQIVRDYSLQFKNWMMCSGQIEEYKFNWLDVFLTGLALVYFVSALLPELGHDALAMHMFVSGHMAHQHQWGFDAGTYVWAVMPMLGDWIYSVGYVLGGETASRLINISFVFFLTGLIRELVFWGGGDKETSRWTNLLFLSTPLTFAIGSSLFVESVWSSFAIGGALIVLQICAGTDRWKTDIALAGLLLGFAISAKAISLMFLPALFLVLLWRWRFWFNSTCIKATISGLGLFLCFGLVPYLTAFWKTGNPVFPFFNQIFASEYYPAVNFDSSTIFGKGVSWDFLYRVMFHTGEFLESHVGGSGFQWLLLFLPAVGVLFLTKNKRVLLLLTVAGISLFLTFQSVSYLRYVFPEWVMLTVVTGCALYNELMRQSVFRKTVINLGFLTLGLNCIFLSSAGFYGDFALKTLLSDSKRREYLNLRLPARNAVTAVNHLNSGNMPVAIFTYPFTAGLAADALHVSWYNFRFKELIDSAQDEKTIAEILVAQGVDYVILQSTWGTDEKRKLIQQVTDEVCEFGDISIRCLSERYRFSNELLQSADFEQIAGWTINGQATFDELGKYVSVDVGSPVYQVIEVAPMRKYMNVVEVRSPSPGSMGRMQINWLDSKGKFISTDIRPIECTDSWSTYTLKVISPSNAQTAMIYASGHTTSPVQFKKNSFLE